MIGFDCLGAEDAVGFDYMALLKGASGALSGVAEGFDKKGGGDSSAEKARLEASKREAEKSASTMKMLLIGLVGVLGIGGIAVAIAMGRKK